MDFNELIKYIGVEYSTMVLSAFDLLISKNIHRDVNTFHHDTISHKYVASATDGLRSPSEQFTISRWILQSFI